MLSGSLGSLLFILTLALAILSTAQAFDLFSRHPAPEPPALVEPVAGAAIQTTGYVLVGEQPSLSMEMEINPGYFSSDPEESLDPERLCLPLMSGR